MTLAIGTGDWMTSDGRKKTDQDSDNAADQADDAEKRETAAETPESGSAPPEAQVAGMEGAAVSVPDSDSPKDNEAAAETAEAGSEKEEARTEEPAAAAPEKVRRSDGLARLLALLAIVGVAAVIGLTQVEQIEGGSAQRIAALERQVETLKSSPAASAEPDPRVAELQSGVSDLRGRIAEIAASVETLSAEAASAGATDIEPVIGELGGRIDQMQARLDELDGMKDRLAALESSAAAPVAAADSGAAEATQKQVAELGDRLSEMDGELTRLKGQQENLVSDLDDRIDGVRTELAKALERKTGDVIDRLNEITAQAAAAGKARESEVARNAALVLAMGRLRDAAAGDRPFPGAWDSVTALGADPAAYPAVADAAAKGVASLAALKQRFPDVASQAVVAATTGEDDSFIGGALRRVGNIVRVRRTGEVEGDSVEAIVARAEARVNEDDLKAAVGELAALQGEAADAVAPWKAEAERRIALDAGVDALQADVFRNLSKDD